MTKERQTRKKYSIEFKLCVILDKLNNDLSRNETVRKYWHTTSKQETHKYTARVSEWERKYLLYGEEGLMPKQRKPNSKSPSTKSIDGDVEAELKRLRERNLWLEAENAYLKKLDALIRAEEELNGKTPK